MSDTLELRPLNSVVNALEGGATAFSLCEIAEGFGVTSRRIDGVSAYLVLSGTLHITLACGSERSARTDSLVLLPPNTSATLSSGTAATAIVDGRDSVCRRGAWSIADATGGRPLAMRAAAARISGTSHARLSDLSVVSLQHCAEGRRLVGMLRSEVEEPGPAGNALATALLTACIVLGLRRAPQDAGEAVRHPQVASLARAVAAIQTDPCAPHTIDGLARLSGMSRATFLRHFSRAWQTSPSQFVQRARLIEAAGLLRSGGLSVKTVATRSGFASRSHFSRQFTKMFGRSPASYRSCGSEKVE